jgi:hypothetical protein
MACVFALGTIRSVNRCLSQYSVWLRAGPPGDRGSIPSRGEWIFPVTLCPDLGAGLAQSV